MHPRHAQNSANASRQALNFWTDERVTLLGQLAGQQLGCVAIAEKIGDGCTKNMVIGKCRRAGIPLIAYSNSIERARKRQAAAKEARIKARVEKLRGEIARLLQQIITLQASAPSRVSRETSGKAA